MAIRNEIQKANRFSHRFSILRIEIDADEKAAPDSLELARTVTGALRTTDLLARSDAGIFFVLLPQTDALGAGILAERIRRSWLGLHKGERGEGVATLQSVSVSYPADGGQVESLMALLEARVAESRAGLLATRPDLREIRALDPFFDRLLEQGDVQPAEIEGQVLRFVLEDAFRRPGDRGVLIMSPGASWLAEVLETLHETRGRDTQTEIVMLADGTARQANPQLTWISKSSLDDRRPLCRVLRRGASIRNDRICDSRRRRCAGLPDDGSQSCRIFSLRAPERARNPHLGLGARTKEKCRINAS